MKRKAEPAFVEDADPETDDALPTTRRSASIGKTTKRNGYSIKRRCTGDRSRTKRASSSREATSIHCGPILQAISQYDSAGFLTILSGSSDRTVERNEVKGRHIRKFFYQDDVINRESSTFVERELLISEEDAKNINPHVLLEQKTYKDNKELMMGKQLFFGEQLVDGRVYIFKACGDEIAGEKTPDLHLTARVLSPPEWSEYNIGTVKYFGYDKNINISVSSGDTMEINPISDPFDQQHGAVSKANPCSGISISSKTVRQSVTDRGSCKSCKRQDSHTFTIKFLGLGAASEDGLAKGDVNLRIHLD